MRIYISGPISGYKESNLPRFRAAEMFLKEIGNETVVPHDIPPYEHDGECPKSYTRGPEHSAACYLRTDLAALLTCDAIHMLKGWERSVGAQLEHHVAAMSGLSIFYYNGYVPVALWREGIRYDR